MIESREEMLAARFPRLLQAWLRALPPAGWTGTAQELADSLETLNKAKQFYAFVPYVRIKPEIEGRLNLIEAAGWSLAFKRTAKARTVVFAPLRKTAGAK